MLPVVLDQVDDSIIELLQRDGRIPVRRLAAAVGMSETAVRQRLQRLQGDGVIRVIGLVDPQALGRPLIAWFLIRTNRDSQDVGKRVGALSAVRWLVRCQDVDRLVAEISCATNSELLAFVNDQLRPIEGVESAETLIHLQTHVTEFRYSSSYMSNGRSEDVWVRGASPSRPLDAVDRIIVDALQQDGRITFKRLGDLAGLTTASARQRYQRLVRDGILRVRAVPDPARLGMEVVALLGVTVRGSSTAIAESMMTRPEVTLLCECAGRYDILVEVVCRDRSHFEALFHDAVRGNPSVRTVDVFRYGELIKDGYGF